LGDPVHRARFSCSDTREVLRAKTTNWQLISCYAWMTVPSDPAEHLDRQNLPEGDRHANKVDKSFLFPELLHCRSLLSKLTGISADEC
jgi:hypothetical protein